VQGRNTAWW